MALDGTVTLLHVFWIHAGIHVCRLQIVSNEFLWDWEFEELAVVTTE